MGRETARLGEGTRRRTSSTENARRRTYSSGASRRRTNASSAVARRPRCWAVGLRPITKLAAAGVATFGPSGAARIRSTGAVPTTRDAEAPRSSAGEERARHAGRWVWSTACLARVSHVSSARMRKSRLGTACCVPSDRVQPNRLLDAALYGCGTRFVCSCFVSSSTQAAQHCRLLLGLLQCRSADGRVTATNISTDCFSNLSRQVSNTPPLCMTAMISLLTHACCEARTRRLHMSVGLLRRLGLLRTHTQTCQPAAAAAAHSGQHTRVPSVCRPAANIMAPIWHFVRAVQIGTSALRVSLSRTAAASLISGASSIRSHVRGVRTVMGVGH